MREPVDVLLLHANRLLTIDPGDEGETNPLGVIEDGAIAIRGETIVAIGPSDAISQRYTAPPSETHELAGQIVLPGFIDPHTHVLFAGTREREFSMRLAGVSYMEIAAAGGGIVSSVEAFRNASDEQILSQTRARCDEMLALGTTTVEAKSGYGLETEQEIRALRLIDQLDRSHPLDLLGTFLGAHEFPPEFKARRDDYVRLVVEEMIPRVAAETRARFCDVFCEEGVFTPEQARTILTAAEKAGLSPRIHADEFAPSGAAELAGEIRALSADHLMEVTDEGLESMARGGTVAILLPGTSFSIGKRRYAPARKILERGLRVALATDCNPGSSMTVSLPLILSLAVLEMEMTLPEAIQAVTVHAAASLGLQERVGRLKSGFQADLQVLPTTHEAGIVYQLGGLPPSRVMKRGEWVVHQGQRLN